MDDELEVAEAHKARAEREFDGQIEYLLLLAAIAVGAVGELTLLATAIGRLGS